MQTSLSKVCRCSARLSADFRGLVAHDFAIRFTLELVILKKRSIGICWENRTEFLRRKILNVDAQAWNWNQNENKKLKSGPLSPLPKNNHVRLSSDHKLSSECISRRISKKDFAVASYRYTVLCFTMGVPNLHAWATVDFVGMQSQVHERTQLYA